MSQTIFEQLVKQQNGLLEDDIVIPSKRLCVTNNYQNIIDCVENVQNLNFETVNNLLDLNVFDDLLYDTKKYAVLTVVCETQRLQTKGKLLLHQSAFENFQSIVWKIYLKSTKHCLSYSIPFTLNSHFRFHLQLDFDKIRYSPVSHDKQQLYNLISKHLRDSFPNETFAIFITMPQEDNQGVHVQVHGICMSVDSLKQFAKHSDEAIGHELKNEFELKVDTGISCAFVPGTSKNCLVSNVYRKHNLCLSDEENSFDFAPVIFPLCAPPCSCKYVEFSVPNRFDTKLIPNVTKVCQASMELLQSQYTVEYLIENHFSNNEMIKFIYLEGIKLLIETMNDICDQDYFQFRYTITHLAFALVALADRMLNMYDCEKLNTFYWTIIKQIMVRSKGEHSKLNVKLMQCFEQQIKVVSAAFTRTSPTINEVMFTLLHMICWSNVPVFKKGTITASGNLLIGSCITNFIFEKYLALLEDEVEFGEVYIDKDANITSLAKKYCAIKRPSANQFGSFILAITHPYDGKSYWTCCKRCSWLDISREGYQYSHLDKTKHYFSCTKRKEPYKYCRSPIACISEIKDIWQQAASSTRPFPPGFLVCENMRIYCVRTKSELYCLPFMRTNVIHETGIKDVTFNDVANNPNNTIDAFCKLLHAVYKLPCKTYYSWPNGAIVKEIENNNEISPEVLNIANAQYKLFAQHTSLPHEVLQGMVALMEVYVCDQRIIYLILLLRDIILRDYRKKVVIAYSKESNHGKSSMVKVLGKLLKNALSVLSFNAVSAQNEAECKNAALVEASGKLVAIIDEIVANPFATRGSLAHCISSLTIRTLTGDTVTRGWRRLRENCDSLYFYLSLFIFCNNFPTFSSCGEAEKDRLHFIEHKRAFPPSDQSNFDVKLTHMATALQYLIIAFHYGSDYAASILNYPEIAFTTAVDPSFSPDYKSSIEFYSYVDVIINKFLEQHPDILTITTNFSQVNEMFKTFAFGNFSGHINSNDYINKLHSRYTSLISNVVKVAS